MCHYTIRVVISKTLTSTYEGGYTCLFEMSCYKKKKYIYMYKQYPLGTSYCIPFRTLSITHSSVFLVDHSISRISTQQWISRNLFTFGPMLIGTFLLN